SAAIRSRSSNSHQGVRSGVSSALLRSRRIMKAGKRTRRGCGGVARKRSQIAGNAASAARMSGAEKESAPRENIAATASRRQPEIAQRGEEREQRRFGGPVCAVGDERPAVTAR